jgi:hypothetical protein
MNHDFILLDRSGSMTSRWQDALAAVNSYAKKLADDGVDTGVTVATFDSPGGMMNPASVTAGLLPRHTIDFTVVRDRITPPTFKPVDATEVLPRGGTPLNDAVVRMVNLIESGGYTTVALTVITDGEENSSVTSHAGAKAAIERLQARGWQVIFIGCDFNNVQQAHSYGVQGATQLSASSANLAAATANLAGKRYDNITRGTQMGYTDAEKALFKS